MSQEQNKFTTISMSDELRERLIKANDLRPEVSEQWIWKASIKVWERQPEDVKNTYNEKTKYFSGKTICGINKESSKKYNQNLLRYILDFYLTDVEENLKKIPRIKINLKDLKSLTYDVKEVTTESK